MDSLIDIFASFKTKAKQQALVLKLRDESSEDFSYKDLYLRALGFALHLKTLGIKQGDKIVLCAPNSPNWVFAYWGIFVAGAVLVPLDHNLKKEEIFKLAEFSGAKLVLSATDFEQNGKLPSINVLTFNFATQEVIFDLPKIKPSDLAEIVFTSGTTGEPKGVSLSHGNIISNIKQVLEVVPVEQKENFLTTLTFSIMFQQTLGLLVPWSVGASVILLESYSGENLVKAWVKEQASIIITVPVLMQRLMDYLLSLPESQKNNLLNKLKTNFNYFVCGAAAMPQGLKDFWQQNNFSVYEGYGLTECSPVVTGNLPPKQKPQTVGRALPGVNIKIEQGEILVKGENIFTGYYNNSQATKAAFTNDGWFKTGDLGEIDQEGFVKVLGRKDDVITTVLDQAFFPEEIEKVFFGLKGIKEICVVPRAEGQEIKLDLVVIPATGFFNKQAFLEQANTLVPKNRHIEKVVKWPFAMFPRTALGKLQRYKIKRWLSFG